MIQYNGKTAETKVKEIMRMPIYGYKILDDRNIDLYL